ncbi:MAG: hypothetical protein J7L47_03075 [Candidatus Odinarchaeota archaeon]|nr:hypothetical protein [Candidatus Odinarchaeota archaeon]
MVEMDLSQEFSELLNIKHNVTADLEKIDGIIRLAQASALDDGNEELIKRSERLRKMFSLLMNDIKYLPVPESGDIIMLQVMTLLLTIMHSECRAALKMAEKLRNMAESGELNVTSEVNSLSRSVSKLRELLSDIREVQSGTLDRRTLLRMREKYSEYISKINEAIAESINGSVEEKMKIYYPERPSLWKRVFIFWKYGKKGQLKDYLTDLLVKVRNGELDSEWDVYQLYDYIRYENKELKFTPTDLISVLKGLQKSKEIPGFVDENRVKLSWR